MGELLRDIPKSNGGRPTKTPDTMSGVSTLTDLVFVTPSRAERRGGELLRDIPKNNGRPKKKPDTLSGFSTLKELGVSEKQSSRWQMRCLTIEPVYPLTHRKTP